MPVTITKALKETLEKEVGAKLEDLLEEEEKEEEIGRAHV